MVPDGQAWTPSGTILIGREGFGAANATGFCRLASHYAWLERLMFGRGLERTRFCLVKELRDCRDILLLGEGDGRCLERLLRIVPQARVHCVDASPAMLRRAAARIAESDHPRVTFECADLLKWRPTARRWDAVVTLFFLDCFGEIEVRELVGRMQPTLRPGGRWLWADFVLPAGGAARWRAQFWLGVMYGFFRMVTRLTARRLPPTENILHEAGWRPESVRQFPGIFARSAIYRRAALET